MEILKQIGCIILASISLVFPLLAVHFLKPALLNEYILATAIGIIAGISWTIMIICLRELMMSLYFE